jgi:hypothetical protein
MVRPLRRISASPVHLKALRSRGPELVKLYAPMNESVGRICADLSIEQLKTIADFLESVSAAAAEAGDHLKAQDDLSAGPAVE